MKPLSGKTGIGVSNFRFAAVLLFVVLNLTVFFLRAASVWRYGALFTAGSAASVIYPVWKAVHHLPVYGWPLSYPFSLAMYNYLFYSVYALFLRVAGVAGAGTLIWGSLFTAVFALAGALAQWKLVEAHLHLRGLRSALSLALALGLWSCTSIVRSYALSIRPDIAAVAMVMIALCLAVRQPRFGFAGAGLFFYLAWAFKQSAVLSLVGVCLFLLFSKRWRDLGAVAAVFAVLTAATLLLGTAQYRYNILLAPRIMSVFSWRQLLWIAPKTLIANAYWVLAPAALLLTASARRADPAVRLLISAFAVALAAGVAGMARTGAWDHYLLEAFASGSTVLQMAVFLAPGGLVSALLLFACLQPGVQAATVPSGDHPHPFGTVGIATPTEYASAVAIRDRLAAMKKPIFTTDPVFSLPWYSNGNRAPALVIDTIFHDATRARCQNGCVEGMLQRGEIPTVMLPAAAASAAPAGQESAARRPAAAAIGLLKKLLGGGGSQASLYPGVRSDAIYRQSMSPDYKLVGEYRHAGGMWNLYALSPQAPEAGNATGQTSAGAH
ncbi:MAG: hypothetical protein ACP5FH_00425 [Terracidiphilus sp.]